LHLTSSLFRDVARRRSAACYRYFGTMSRSPRIIFLRRPDPWRFVRYTLSRNVASKLPTHTAQYPRKAKASIFVRKHFSLQKMCRELHYRHVQKCESTFRWNVRYLCTTLTKTEKCRNRLVRLACTKLIKAVQRVSCCNVHINNMMYLRGVFMQIFIEKERKIFRNIWYIKGADKYLAEPRRKQATATEDSDFRISYL